MADWASNSAQPSYPSSTFHARAGKEWDDDSDTEDSNPPEGNKDESAKEDEEKPTDRSTPYSRSGSKFFPKASERRPFEKYTGAETHDDDFGASKGTTFEADTTPKDGTASKQHPPTELGPSPHGVPRRGAESFRSGSSKSNWFGDCTGDRLDSTTNRNGKEAELRSTDQDKEGYPESWKSKSEKVMQAFDEKE